jgi:hypothetical protein
MPSVTEGTNSFPTERWRDVLGAQPLGKVYRIGHISMIA